MNTSDNNWQPDLPFELTKEGNTDYLITKICVICKETMKIHIDRIQEQNYDFVCGWHTVEDLEDYEWNNLSEEEREALR